MAETYDLDLDLLQPQPKTVKLGGKFYEVSPPKLKDVANLSRLAGKLSAANSNPDEAQQNIAAMLKAFEHIMPALKSDEVDLSINQLLSLFQFVISLVNPDENSALKEAGFEPVAEKKTPGA